MKVLFVTLVLASACENSDSVSAPKASDCIEFDHKTSRDGRLKICHMVWCEKEVSSVGTEFSTHPTGGLASLWCADVPVDGGVPK